jgi:hypothetical protein
MKNVRLPRFALPLILLLVIAPLTLAAGAGIWNGYQTASVVVNGTRLQSDVPGIIVQGRTMLPVRAIADAIGAEVDWNPDTYTVTLTTPGAPKPEQKPSDGPNDPLAAAAQIYTLADGPFLKYKGKMNEWEWLDYGREGYARPKTTGTVIGPLSIKGELPIGGVRLSGQATSSAPWPANSEMVVTVQGAKSPGGPWVDLSAIPHKTPNGGTELTLPDQLKWSKSLYFKLTTTKPIQVNWGYDKLEVVLTEAK